MIPITTANPSNGITGSCCALSKVLRGSLLSPSPSPLASSHSVASSGNLSFESEVPSPSSSASALSPVPSPSVSTDSVASSGKASLAS